MNVFYGWYNVFRVGCADREPFQFFGDQYIFSMAGWLRICQPQLGASSAGIEVTAGNIV